MKKLLAGFFCALFAVEAAAYQVTLPIQDKSKSGMEAGIRQGAEELILQLTAQRSAVKTLSKELNHAQLWVDQYSTASHSNDPDHPWLLDVAYSKNRIQQLLDAYHLPYWKQPPKPVSLLLKTTADNTIAENDPRWLALRDAAALRGYILNHLEQTPSTAENNTQTTELIVATLPDEQATDPTSENPTEITADQTNNNAKENRDDVKKNTIQWSWYHQGQWQQWQQTISKQWAEQATEKIAAELIQAQLAATTNNLTTVHLTIDGIRDFSAYIEAIRSLNQLNHVQSIMDRGVKNDQISLTIITDLPLFEIKHSLDNLQPLTPQPNNAPADSQIDLNYHWGTPLQPAEAAVAPTPVAETALEPKSAVDEQVSPPDNAVKDDTQRPKKDLTPQD